jgi:hypothetical protein
MNHNGGGIWYSAHMNPSAGSVHPGAVGGVTLHGLSVQVSMAPHVLKRPVNVFSGQQQVGTYEPGGKTTNKQPINLLYDGVGHYDLLVQHRPTSRL